MFSDSDAIISDAELSTLSYGRLQLNQAVAPVTHLPRPVILLSIEHPTIEDIFNRLTNQGTSLTSVLDSFGISSVLSRRLTILQEGSEICTSCNCPS